MPARPLHKPALRQLRRLATSLALIAATATGAAADQRDSAIYDLQIRGIKAGTLSVAGAIEDGHYVATGRLQSAGIVAWIKKFSYDAHTSGSVTGTKFTPQRYEETADTGKRRSESLMEYLRGTPQVKRYNPPRKPRDRGVDPASQGGSVDPMTATYAVLRDVPQDEACHVDLRLFDGERASRVRVGSPRKEGNSLICAGEYRRVAGFSKDDMAEKTSFYFTVTYVPSQTAGMLQVKEVSMDTVYGKGRLIRR